MNEIIKKLDIRFVSIIAFSILFFILISFLSAPKINASTILYECSVKNTSASFNDDTLNLRLVDNNALEADSGYYFYYLNLAIEKSSKL